MDGSTRKNLIKIMLAVLLALLAIPAFYLAEKRFSYARLEGYLKTHAITEDIYVSGTKDIKVRLNDTGDPSLYLAVLPQNADELKRLQIGFSHFHTITLGDKSYRPGADISDTVLSSGGEPLSMKLYAVGGELLYEGWIRFLFAGDTPSIFINTEDGGIDTVDATEEGEIKPHVSSNLRIVSGDGVPAVITDAEIFRHGNSTFDNYDPKSYNLTLRSKQSLLGLPAGRKWVLKANAMDTTQLLRNSLSFKASEIAGLTPYPGSAFTGIYINGKYNGLYLLTPRINGPELMGLKDGEYFLEQDHRYEQSENYFTFDGKGIVIHYPETLSSEDLSLISSDFAKASEAIKNDAYEDFIDTDSFVRMYVIQDLFVQSDVDFSSLYFYRDREGIYHSGPVWDFDLSCGLTSSEPYHEELAKRARLFDSPGRQCAFLTSLNDSDRFMDEVSEFYLNDFCPAMLRYLDEEWDKDFAGIAQSLDTGTEAMQIPQRDKATLDDPEALKSWLKERLLFLRDYYKAPDDYANVTFHFAWGTMPATVKKGSPLGFLPDDDHPGNTEDFWGAITGFADKDGNIVTDSLMINEDIDLYAIYEEGAYAWEEYNGFSGN